MSFLCVCRNSFFRQKYLLLAERAAFGKQIPTFLCPRVMQIWFRMTQSSSKGYTICRNTFLRQKYTLSAERHSFGRISVSAEINIFKSYSFGFRQKEKKSLSFDLYQIHPKDISNVHAPLALNSIRL